MKKPTRTTKLCEDLAKDVEDLRSGTLDKDIATAICRHINAIVKAENIELQYDRIAERESRPIK
jgi:hypothetical protein